MIDPGLQVRQGLGALVFIAITALGGYVFLCGLDWFDAAYMLVITISTVGYREVGGDTSWTRLVNMYVIVLGITASFYMFGGLIRAMTEGQIQRVVTRQLQTRAIENLTGHHIVCGFGRMGAILCEELKRRGEPVVLVEQIDERVAAAGHAGYLCVQGDATREETLTEAGILRARSLVCVLPSDADNVFVTLTGRDMNSKLFILARAEQLSTEKKLIQAGADRVVAPQAIGALRIANLIVRPTTVEILELVAGRQSVDLEMNEFQLPDSGPLHGQSLAESEVRTKTGVIVVAIKRADGNLVINPDSTVALHANDTVVILGRRENIDAFRNLFVPT